MTERPKRWARMGRNDAEIHGVNEEEIAELIRGLTAHGKLYITAFPEDWPDELCEAFGKVAGLWLDARQVPPTPPRQGGQGHG